MTSRGRDRARRAGLAVAGGVLLYAAHPPADLGWLGLVAVVPLLALGRDLRAAARPVAGGLWWGLLSGLVFFATLLTWLVPFGVVAWLLLALIQAAFIGLFVAAVAAWGQRRFGAAAAVVAWVAMEAARTRWPLGGFPWGALGYSQHEAGLLLPVARSLGVLGVSAACAAVAACVECGLAHRSILRPFLGLLGVAAVASGLAAVPPPAPGGDRLDIAAVQGNDLQRSGAAGVARLDDERIVNVAEAMLEATRPLAGDPPDVTVWPENSLDADVTDPANAELRSIVSSALELLNGEALVAGGLLAGPRPGTVYNAVLELGPGLAVDDTYRKRHPVPFGEYVPLRPVLGALPPLRQIPRDVLGADSPGIVTVAGAPLGFVICFENIFPALVRDQVRAGAELLVVSTNNASYGYSAMSRQHLAFSQLRAVESGRWTLHAGISGTSGIIDPSGRVSQRTRLYDEAIVRGELPLVSQPTPYVVLGDVVGVGAMTLAVLAMLGGFVGRARKGRTTR
jgi:apolipoprotein N-acyltransferase